MKIDIEWLSDYTDCETCGGSGAQGAIVKVDGQVALDFTPQAHCYDSVSWEPDEVFKAILIWLGHEVEQTSTYLGYDGEDE